MAVYVQFVRESSVRLWGLTSRQRLMRVLKSAGVTDVVEDIASVPENSSVLLLRADFLYDDRVIHYLVENPDILLRFTDQHTDAIIAARVSSAMTRQARDVLAEGGKSDSLRGMRTETLQTLSISFQERLRKFEPPFILPITPKDRRILERRLFDWSYKGVTDLVTKWAWPHPARWVVGQCVRFGLRPNHVTIVGLILVVLASILFAYGQYGWGLLAGWLMTFLDTVDGKLARVTVTSSRFGHYFDHIIDIIHPPIWYILWGLGLDGYNPGPFGLSLGALFWLIMAGYVTGRLVEATFTVGLGRFGIFCWCPVDSYFRLVTARRNPCMILLTGCTLFGRPDLGLVAVAFWTVLTSLFLFIRLAMAFFVRIRKGPLKSWLKDADQQFYNRSMALRLFTRRIAG